MVIFFLIVIRTYASFLSALIVVFLVALTVLGLKTTKSSETGIAIVVVVAAAVAAAV